MDDFDVEDYVDSWMLTAVTHFDDTEWFASIPNLNGLWGTGDSHAAALADLRHAVTSWVEMTNAENEGDLPAAPNPAEVPASGATVSVPLSNVPLQ